MYKAELPNLWMDFVSWATQEVKETKSTVADLQKNSKKHDRALSITPLAWQLHATRKFQTSEVC